MLTSDRVQDKISYLSAIMEHIVLKAKQYAFRQWHQTLIHNIQQTEGSVRLDLHPALECKNGVLKCYSVLHFDSQTYLKDWLTSIDRQEIIKSEQQFFETYRFKSLITGSQG
jgi:uncharacterized protein